MFIGMVLETIGVSLAVPAIALLTHNDIGGSYPALVPFLERLGNPSQQTLVVGGMLALVCVYLIKATFLAMLTWWQMRFAFGVQAQLSQRLFSVYLHQPYTFHLQRNSAQLIRNVTGEVGLFTYNAVMPGLLLFTETLVLFGLCSLLLFIEPAGTLIVGGAMGLTAWGFHRMTREYISEWGKARQLHDGLRIQHLQQGLGGVKDIIVLGRVTDFMRQYEIHNVQSARVGQRTYTLQQLPRLWLELLAVGGLAILVITMLAQGRALHEVLPTLGLFAAAAFRLMPSVNRILGAVQSLRYGLPIIDNLSSELNLAAPELPAVHPPMAPFRSTLELDRVTYSHPGTADPVLNEVSLTIKHGESIGFIGTSGAGKSTLVDILLGLYMPDSGEVRVDGVNIRTNLRRWQDQIGYVPQTIFMTDDTLRRNVAFGLADEQIDDTAVRRAIQAAQLDEFVASLPKGLEAVVGERGIRLSGGQRQRIGIARALYHDPSVLVLDEATSSLDAATEQNVMQAVEALHGRKTVLIVAHRLSTIERCDRLYRVEKGGVVEHRISNESDSEKKLVPLHRSE